jgi:diguanylate cyclase (GGDEF)-like protein
VAVGFRERSILLSPGPNQAKALDAHDQALSVVEAPIKQLAQQHELEAKAEHLRLISKQVIFVFLGNFVASVTLLVGSWEAVSSTHLLAWCLSVVGFNTLRLVVVHRFAPEQLSQQEAERWERRFLGSALVSGLLWGAAGFFFFVPGELGHNFFLTTLILGMAAGAVTAHSYHQMAYPAFFIPAIAPLVFNLLSEPAISARAVGAAMPFYFLLMYLLSRRFYESAHAAILGRFVNYYFATHDYLTGVANRRAFQEALEREWARALRTNKPLSLIIADADDFKLFNDSHGHAAGDKVLEAIAHLIRDRIRKGTDLVARIGGEEFAVVLPETILSDARSIAEDVKNQVRKIEFVMEAKTASPTLSVGVASMIPRSDLNPNVLFNAADRALYLAKSQGKDRVVVDETDQLEG